MLDTTSKAEGAKMNRRVRTLLGAVVGVLLTTLLTAQGAEAQAGPAVTVTPSTGLQDGQVVTVTGTGFTTGTSDIGLAQCPASPSSFILCVGQKVVPASQGSFSATFTVRRIVGGVDCASAPGACVIGATNLQGPNGAFTEQVFVPLTFGRSAPQSKADCKHGGWRDLADDQGRPFRNQGQCVSFVVAHRP